MGWIVGMRKWWGILLWMNEDSGGFVLGNWWMDSKFKYVRLNVYIRVKMLIKLKIFGRGWVGECFRGED